MASAARFTATFVRSGGADGEATVGVGDGVGTEATTAGAGGSGTGGATGSSMRVSTRGSTAIATISAAVAASSPQSGPSSTRAPLACEVARRSRQPCAIASTSTVARSGGDSRGGAPTSNASTRARTVSASGQAVGAVQCSS
ncbi:MAG: hypothetical protein IPN32_32950 [Deltaproteobacteria bacterium]|nr:hypothetical protein [Deltaproteobacteria bacterium]